MYEAQFFKDEKLPFIESRFVKDSKNIYSEHFHETLSIGVVEGDNIIYKCNGDKYELKKNSLAVINPNVIHSCNPKSNKTRTYHMLYIDINWCKSLQAFIFGNTKGFIPLKYIQIDDKKLYDEFIELNYTLLDKEVFYLKKEELIEEFFTNLFKAYCSYEDKKEEYFVKSKDYVQKIKEYIDLNIKRDITIQEISSYIGLSKFHIIKIFNKEMKMTPHKYLLNKKINTARELLSKGKDIVDVALELGFYDQSHLNRVFKKYVAATPNEYKKSLTK